MKGLKDCDHNDIILISDVDEIPNLYNVNLKNIKNKIILFDQDIFYYKLYRYFPNFVWFGPKACKKKYLITNAVVKLWEIYKNFPKLIFIYCI